MASTAPGGSGAVKRSIGSSDDGSESVSSVKKSKESSDEPAQDKQESNTKKLLKLDKPENASQSDCSGNTLKRPNEVFVGETQCFSPSKKRKIANTKGEVGETLGTRLHGNEEIDKRKKRIKNKALLKTVMEQMEFYFSDSNLSKDRYLRQLFDETKDGYIDMAVFNNFNKLQSLFKGAVPLKILSTALRKSKLLELNEDRTKVRRSTPFKELDQEEVDKRTVYVEHLPSYASHAWIRKIFSPCGKVCYVSLPIYKTSKDIKGFAFVEFSSAEEAAKACSMLNNPTPTKAEEKPGKFPKGNKFLYRAHRIVPSVKVEEPDSNEENVQNESKEDQVISPTKKKKKKNVKRKPDESVEKSSEQTDNPEERKKKKKKRKKQAPVEEVGNMKEKDTNESKPSKGEFDGDGDKKCEEPLKVTDNLCQQNSQELETNNEINSDTAVLKKKKKRKKLKKPNAEFKFDDMEETTKTEDSAKVVESTNAQSENMEEQKSNSEVKLSRTERKRLRQEDIRKKKAERVFKNKEEKKEVPNQPGSKETTSEKNSETQSKMGSSRQRFDSLVSESSETDDSSKIYRKSDGSQLTSCLIKSKKQVSVKKVEFDPVPVTTEFIERKEVRRRKKPKKEGLHLRVLSKREWLSLRKDYMGKQKSHMAALKESLRELRMQEGAIQTSQENDGTKHVDLTNVFGTKRMKPTRDIKMAHLEELKFIPNVIVQWKCSHEINRNKIRTMFKGIPNDKIAYIEGKEEAESGYIRFKDEASAEEFARLSRSSDSFSARVLPESQQAAYWEKANQDRIAKLGRKKNERGTDRIARKVFEKNKATFHEKGSHIVFEDDDDVDNNKDVPRMFASIANENQHDLEESFLAIFRK